MIKLKRTILLVLAGACLAAGCGSDEEGDPIPADSAAVLQDQLDGVQRRLDNGSVGACDDILAGPRGPNVDAVNQAIASLPERVDADVRSALQDGFDRLFELVEERCTELREAREAEQPPDTTEEEPPPVIETEATPPPETETQTQTETTPDFETETLPPETTPETTPEPAPETTPEPAPEEPTTPEGEEGGGVIAPEGGEG